jgi:hypothetical protein
MTTSADRPVVEAPAEQDDTRSADVVIAATACTTVEAVRAAGEAVIAAGRLRAPRFSAVLVHPDSVGSDPALADLSGGMVRFVAARLPLVSYLPLDAAGLPGLLPPLAAIQARTGARACALVGTLAEGVTAEAIHALVAPVLDHEIDLVCPIYPRHPVEGLINSGIVYPLTRALYGKRVDGQLGIDFGFSARFLATIAEAASVRTAARPLWPVAEAVGRGMPIGQAYLDRWMPPFAPVTDVSTALADVVGSLFSDVERHAPLWQRTRGSSRVAAFGAAGPAPPGPRAVDVSSMIESYRIGFSNLPEVWGRLLPPATLIDLGRLARRSAEEFRMPDQLWARVVYDFALGFRLRYINRDHLLRAMTPLYLAWAASFISDLGGRVPESARDRVEQLAGAYESEKPYLVARWRWPDRFNP